MIGLIIATIMGLTPSEADKEVQGFFTGTDDKNTTVSVKKINFDKLNEESEK